MTRGVHRTVIHIVSSDLIFARPDGPASTPQPAAAQRTRAVARPVHTPHDETWRAPVDEERAPGRPMRATL